MKLYSLAFSILIGLICIVLTFGCGTEAVEEKEEEPPVLITGEWKEIGFIGEDIQRISSYNQKIYISTNKKIHFSNTNDLENWTSINIDSELNESESIRDFVVIDEGEILCVTQGDTLTYKTFDSGENWTKYYNELTEHRVLVNDIAIDRNNQVLYSLHNGAHLTKSMNGGENWIPIYSSGSDFWDDGVSSLDRIRIDTQNPEKIWLMGSGITGSPRIVVTNDMGLNWKNYNLNTSQVGGPVRDIKFSRIIENKTMLAFLGGTFTTIDLDAEWENVLENELVLNLEYGNITDESVYASGRVIDLENDLKIELLYTSDFGKNWQKFEYQTEHKSRLYVNDMLVLKSNGSDMIFLASSKGLYSFTAQEL